MAVIASFVSECAASGRWARGLLAVQSHLPSEDPAVHAACGALAVVTAQHNWEAAVMLLQHNHVDSRRAAEGVDTLSRNPRTPPAAYVDTVAYLLRIYAARANVSEKQAKKSANDIFLSATKWVAWRVAAACLEAMPADSRSVACEERVTLLQNLETRTREEMDFYFPPAEMLHNDHHYSHQLSRGTARQRPLTPRDEREMMRVRAIRAQKDHQERVKREQLALIAALEPLPTWWSVATLLRLSARSPATTSLESSPKSAMLLAPSWRTALAVLGSQPITEGLLVPYARCVGLRAPHIWQHALQHLGTAVPSDEESATDNRSRQLLPLLWLLSQGSSGATLDALRSPPTTPHMLSEEDEVAWSAELLARSSLPRSDYLAAYPAKQAHPPHRLPSQTQRCLAQALASGLRLDEIQMSAMAKQWAAGGCWLEALALYQRMTNAEFQKHSVKAFLKRRDERSRHGTKDAGGDEGARGFPSLLQFVDAVSKRNDRTRDGLHRHKLVPPTTYTASELVKASADWAEALSLLRRCVGAGTQCLPQLMSAVMDKKPPKSEMQRLAGSYPAAVNNGIRQRLTTEYNISS